MSAARDQLRRPLRSLRLSVTDRCNLRCRYCMPEAHYTWLPKSHLLSFEELDRLVGVFHVLGVDKVRLTGGEPLLRRDVAQLVARLAARPGIRDLALTTNGVHLADHATALSEAGLDRLTISLDTLLPDRFQALTGRDDFERVLEGFDAAQDAGFLGTKIDSVIIRGRNDDELPRLLAFGRERGAEVRFIEYMDVGGANEWSMEQVVSRAEMLAEIERHFGRPEPQSKDGWAPADRFRLPDGTSFGIISSTTEPFCHTCDRSRLTADGQWLLCLYSRTGIDLRELVRSGASDDDLVERIGSVWKLREDRGAELRLIHDGERRALASREELRDNPHLEMHTRGG